MAWPNIAGIKGPFASPSTENAHTKLEHDCSLKSEISASEEDDIASSRGKSSISSADIAQARPERVCEGKSLKYFRIALDAIESSNGLKLELRRQAQAHAVSDRFKASNSEIILIACADIESSSGMS